MEVGVRVDAIGLGEQEPRNVNTAYFTFVAINGDGKKARLPPLLAKTEEEIKRYDEAIARRQVRLDRRKIRNEKVELAVEWNEVRSLSFFVCLNTNFIKLTAYLFFFFFLLFFSLHIYNLEQHSRAVSV